MKQSITGNLSQMVVLALRATVFFAYPDWLSAQQQFAKLSEAKPSRQSHIQAL
jgi:hypothetical protein